MIEKSPDLNSEKGSSERSWEVNMFENHDTHVHRIWTIRVDVDSGDIFFFEDVRCVWMPFSDWKKLQLTK